ncbi:MAG TPA: M23 family metallopeptidase [Gaiellaceae bacterium]|nr:M23 family metallopeptidase [Gaiellaceae bacterium]
MKRWGLIGFVLLLSTAAPAWADDGTTTTVPATTTTTVATTTTAPTPTTTTAPTTTVASTPRFTSARAPLQRGCPAAAIVVVYPRQVPLFLAPPDGKALLETTAGLSASVGRVDVANCRGNVLLRSVSLFGSIQAQQVKLTGETPEIVGLQIGSRSAVGEHFSLGWGRLVVGATTSTYVAALSLTLTAKHDGLPPGTRILVGVGPVPPKPKVVVAPHKKAAVKTKAKKKHLKKKWTHLPLQVTPKLGVKKFVFPLVGDIGVGDSYGGPRSDVPGGWHHGDDIFAPIGTPVVAVADGTVNRVGWEHLGGWRLWVRDTAGDQFYYAHLSGYAPGVLHSKKVTRGEVIGFVGNTGDAFTTSPHLHFEVHPRHLLHLAYDGAVDPTTYLDTWPHVDAASIPHPAHPRLPRTPQLRSEATYVWRELLMARHLVPKRQARVWKAREAFNAGAVATERVVAANAGPASSSSWPVVLAGLGLVALLAGAGGLAYRRRG